MSDSVPLVSCSIVNTNEWHFLERCLEHLQRQTYSALEVIVIDNASTDGSAEAIERQFPWVQLIRCTGPRLGFTQGHNRGIRESRGDFVLPLNPDAYLDPDYVEEMVRAMRLDPRIGLVAGKLYSISADLKGIGTSRVIDGGGQVMHRVRKQVTIGVGEVDSGQLDDLHEIFGVDGAAPLLRREMLNDVEMDGEWFDEDFFMYKEDADLSWRAQLFGWKAVFAAKAVGYHVRTFDPKRRSSVSGDLKFHAVKNRYLLLIKNETPLGFAIHLPWIVLYDLAILGYLVLRERGSLRAYAAVLRLLPRTLAKRREIQRRRVASTAEILRWFCPKDGDALTVARRAVRGGLAVEPDPT